MSARPFKLSEVCYIAKFYKHDGSKMVAYALDRTPRQVINVFFELQRENEVEHYRRLFDELNQWRR